MTKVCLSICLSVCACMCLCSLFPLPSLSFPVHRSLPLFPLPSRPLSTSLDLSLSTSLDLSLSRPLSLSTSLCAIAKAPRNSTATNLELGQALPDLAKLGVDGGVLQLFDLCLLLQLFEFAIQLVLLNIKVALVHKVKPKLLCLGPQRWVHAHVCWCVLGETEHLPRKAKQKQKQSEGFGGVVEGEESGMRHHQLCWFVCTTVCGVVHRQRNFSSSPLLLRSVFASNNSLLHPMSVPEARSDNILDALEDLG